MTPKAGWYDDGSGRTRHWNGSAWTDEAASAQPTAARSTPPAGWYDSPDGRERWFDGTQWTDHYRPKQAPKRTKGPMTSSKLNVQREVVYTREQKGHSLIVWIFLSFCVVGIPGLIYYSVSPNHYWHA